MNFPAIQPGGLGALIAIGAGVVDLVLIITHGFTYALGLILALAVARLT